MNAREEDLFLVDCLLGAHAKLRLAYQNVSLTNQDKNLHLFLFCFAAVNKSIAGFLELFRIGQYDAAAIAFRSILESYADLINVAKIENYKDRLVLTWNSKKLTALKRISENNNDRIESAKKEIEKLNDLVNAERQKGTKEIKIGQKMTLANMYDQYITGYTICSGHVHGDINTVFRGCKQFDIPILELYESKEHDDRMNRTFISIIAKVLFRAAELMNEQIDGGDSAYLYLFGLEYYSIIGFIEKSQNKSYFTEE